MFSNPKNEKLAVDFLERQILRSVNCIGEYGDKECFESIVQEYMEDIRILSILLKKIREELV